MGPNAWAFNARDTKQDWKGYMYAFFAYAWCFSPNIILVPPLLSYLFRRRVIHHPKQDLERPDKKKRRGASITNHNHTNIRSNLLLPSKHIHTLARFGFFLSSSIYLLGGGAYGRAPKG